MSTPQPHDEFERLRQLLALKRHEQPPPGYFQNFSHQVMARINAVEGDAESASLLQLWRWLSERPLWSGLAAAGACGLLVAGLMLLRGPDPLVAGALLPESPAFSSSKMPAAGAAAGSAFVNHLAQEGAASAEAAEPNSTNPVVAPLQPPSLFLSPRLPVEKASFSPNQ